MKIKGFIQKLIINELKKEGKHGYFLITIVEFLFSDAIDDILKEFDDEFLSKVGRKAFPRKLLLGIVLFCHKEGIVKISHMAKACKTNRILRIFTCGKTPSYSTLKRFLSDCNTKAFKKVFLYTLVEFNECHFLKFLHLFIDGTDAIIRGSKFYKITRKELKLLKLLKNEGLLLKNAKVSNKNWQKKIKRKINESSDEKAIELLKIALKNPYKFTKQMASKISDFEEAFQDTEKDFICVLFPKAVMMPTKKGGYDFAFNLQQVMNENNIVIGSILLRKPNDLFTLEDVLLDLRENFKLLSEMISKYGSRNNIKEIQRLLDEAIFIMDAGYFSDFNLLKAEEYGIKAVIMSKSVSAQKNHEFRKKKGIISSEKSKITFAKKDFKRIINGYICPNNQKIELKEIREIKSTKNSANELSNSENKKSYIHVAQSCSQCSFKEKCIGDKDSKIIVDRVTPQSYDMSNKVVNQRYSKIYSSRFQASESINGYLKTSNGILLLSGSDKNEISNEIHLKNTVYNLTRKITLKNTIY